MQKVSKGEGLTDEEINTEIKLSEEYRKVIEQIINLPDIIIEIVKLMDMGDRGNTYAVRNELKNAGLLLRFQKTGMVLPQ